MIDTFIASLPPILEAIEHDTLAHGFTMPSERQTGALLRTLAASKPGGRFLELGTGTGLSAAWLLAGMDATAHLNSVDTDEGVLAIAQRHLASDTRITFHHTNGAAFIAEAVPNTYDLIFADAWPGKYDLLNETLALLNVGGFYVIDDMIPQPNWPDGHAQNVARLLSTLDERSDLTVCRLAWATGIVIGTRTA